jgi:hypothetical protein
MITQVFPFLLIALNSAWTGVAIKSEKVQIHFKKISPRKSSDKASYVFLI